MRIIEAIRTMRAEIRSAYKSEDTEEWFDRVFTKPIGYLWAKLFIRLDWTPNMVTLLSMAIGFTGGLFFGAEAFALNLIGVLLVIWANVLDSTDGQIARLTGQKTMLGRILDGLSTSVWYVGIYVALALRLSDDPAPFTDGQPWGVWIWVLIAISAVFGHQLQCMMADYYRNIHLYFLKGDAGSEMERSREIALKREALSPRYHRFERLYLRIYGGYTRLQEAFSPEFQRLYRGMRAKYGHDLPNTFREDYLLESRKYIQFTNILTFNARAYTLFACVLLGVPLLYFPIELFAFGSLLRYMRAHYESVCVSLMDKYDLPGRIDPKKRPVKKKSTRLFFFLGLVGVLMMLVNVDWSHIDWQAVFSMMPVWIPLIIIIQLVYYALHTAAYRLIIGDIEKGALNLVKLFQLTFSGFALNAVTPVSFMGGEPYRIMELKPRIGLTKATSSTITFTVMNGITHILFWLTGILCYFGLFGFRGGWLRVSAMLLALVVCTALCVLLVNTGRKDRFARHMFTWLTRLPFVGKRVSAFLDAHGDAIDTIDREMVAFLRKPKQFLPTLAIEYATWLIEALEYYMAFRLLGLAMSFPQAVFTLTLASLIGNLMFFIPMQLGAREGGIVLALTWIGASSSYGITTTLLLRLREILFAAAGIFIMLWKNTTVPDTPPDAQAEEDPS